MISRCLFCAIILFGHSLWAQEDPGTRRELREIREFADGTLPDLWEEYSRVLSGRMEFRSSAPIPNWQSLGPNNLDSLAGRVTCHAFNPENPSTIYIGSSTGGLWRTYNGGLHWHLVSDNLPSTRVSAIAIDPIDTNHILVGTGQYMTSSFTLQPGIGLLESFNNGLNWESNSLQFFPLEQVSVTRLVWDRSNEQRIYAATTQGLYRSIDAGQDWELVLTGLISDFELIFKSPERLFAAIHGQGMYRSGDFGDNWEFIENGLPQEFLHRINMDVCDSIPQYMWASYVDPNSFGLKELYQSEDTGYTWVSVPNPPSYLCHGNSCLGWFVNMVAISPTDPDHVMLGGPRLYKTSNGGGNWEWVDYYSNGVGPNNIGLTYIDQWDIGFHPSQPNTVYSFNDGGVHVSYNGGSFWHPRNENLVNADVYRIASYPGDTTSVIAGLQDHGLYYLNNTNNNLVWHQWAIGDGCALSFDPNNPVKAYGDNIFGVHYRSNDVTQGLNGLQSFQNGISGTNSVGFHFVTTHHPLESNILYTANDQYIFKSENGVSWSISEAIPWVKAIAIDPDQPDTVFAASWGNGAWSFHVSEDGGDNWEQRNSPGWRVTDLECAPDDNNTLYATRNSINIGQPHVYRSIDGGWSWVPISEGLPDVSTNTICINPFNTNVIYLGTDLGVFVSCDQGENWTEFNGELPPQLVMDIHYHPMDSTLRMGTLGRGVWKTKSFIPITVGTDEIAPEDLITVGPNPFNEELDIRLNGIGWGIVNVIVLNGRGQKVRDLNSSGMTLVIWDGRDQYGLEVPAGVYFLQFAIKNQRLVKKVIKTKL